MKNYFKSPIGILEITYENEGLTSLKLIEKTDKEAAETSFSKKIKSQLKEYFSGERKTFDIKIKLYGTDFQKKVWKELQKISYGEVKSYSEIAKQIGNKNAQRAVGSACNKNPIMIIIPCHRVISKSGKIGGFEYGVNLKEKLLHLEKGVKYNK